MPRPISWLPRLHEISRTVANSIRSHYDRRDLEQLFQLQPRAAQNLLHLLPSVQVGTSRLIDREVLSTFLDRVRDADDVPALIEQIRQEKTRISKRVVRRLVRRDTDPLAPDELPASIRLTPGHLHIRFDSVIDLAESLYALARTLESPEFATAFEPAPPAPEPHHEYRSMLSTLSHPSSGL